MENIEQVNNYKYLGAILANTGNCEIDKQKNQYSAKSFPLVRHTSYNTQERNK